MFLLGLNKTGLWTMLVLLLVGLSLYPASGRPAFQDEDTVADEDNEQDEDVVEDQDEDGSNEEGDVENTPESSPAPKGGGGTGNAVGGGKATGGSTYETEAKPGAGSKDELLDE